MDLFSNLNSGFEAEMLSPKGKVEPVLNDFHLKITHAKG